MYTQTHMRRIHTQQQAGFTLVEMIVGVFLFTVVMLVAVGALMSILDANRRAQANKAVMNNLHFALESMTREIRVGRDYGAKQNGESVFVFTDKDGCEITYDLFDTNGDGNEEIVRSVSDTNETCTKGDSTGIPMTAPEVTINALEFYVYGTQVGDKTQPHVIIIVRGVAGLSERTRVPFDLQTFVTQRFLDR